MHIHAYAQLLDDLRTSRYIDTRHVVFTFSSEITLSTDLNISCALY